MQLKKETAVGIFVLVGILAISYMAIQLGNVQLFSDRYYPVHANFTDISGLKVNAPVQMFGVEIGYVEKIGLDQEKGLATVRMLIQKEISLMDDAVVSVKTNGLIGDKYLKITPGVMGDAIQPDGTLFDTKPAIILEDLISKFAFGDVEK